jgi:hypothetical protein
MNEQERELDLMVAELEQENRLLRARNERLEREAAPVQEPDTYGYAKRLAEAIWEKHYKSIAPQWKPFEHLIGVLTQIDNMTSGLTTPPAVPMQEPVKNWCETCNGTGTVYQEHQAGCWVGGEHDCPDCDGNGYYTTPPAAQPAPVKVWDAEGYDALMQQMEILRANNRQLTALIRAQPALKPLTDDELDQAWRSLDYTVSWAQHRIDIARAIEAKLKEKNEL